MPTPWIDFKAIRSQVKMLDILHHYHVDIRIKGDQATALCPLPGHPVRQDGRTRTASLSVNLVKGIFKCFGCQASGNAIDFVSLMENLDPRDGQSTRQAALKLVERFDLDVQPSSTPRRTTSSADQPAQNAAKPRCVNTTASSVDRAEGGTAQPIERKQSTDSTSSDQEDSREVIINAPLEFTLQHLDPTHPYLRDRGFTPETIAHFGLGYCGRGMLKNRIAVPLHQAAQLVGYAGRIVDDALISDDCPKYLFPGTRERDGKRYEFHKNRLLYNAHRIVAPVEKLAVVEGFASV